MIEFGKTLSAAREAKGYTVSQIAEMTHIKPSVIEGLEREDFSMIAAPIYGRGFVKLYCEATGLDPKPLVDEFMAIMNGEHEIAIKERPVDDEPPVPEPVAPVPPPPAAPVPPPAPAPEPDLFHQDEPAPEPVASVPPPATPAVPAAKPTASFARFAAPVREDAAPVSSNGLNLRIIILAGCALALLVVLVLGIRGLYRATTSDAAEFSPVATETPAVTETPAAKTPAPAQTAPRDQQNIPSLYID